LSLAGWGLAIDVDAKRLAEGDNNKKSRGGSEGLKGGRWQVRVRDVKVG
jgi:hypothetical protein